MSTSQYRQFEILNKFYHDVYLKLNRDRVKVTVKDSSKMAGVYAIVVEFEGMLGVDYYAHYVDVDMLEAMRPETYERYVTHVAEVLVTSLAKELYMVQKGDLK